MTMSDDTLCRIGDCKTVGFCLRGTRDWFKLVGLDFVTFAKHGLPASVLLATNDGLARQVVDAARKRVANGR